MIDMAALSKAIMTRKPLVEQAPASIP